jgi:RHS repeat-associated protein
LNPLEEVSSLTQPTEWLDPTEPSAKTSGPKKQRAKKDHPTTSDGDSATSEFYYDSNGLRIARVFYWNDETEYLYRDLYTYDGDLLVHRVGPPPRPAVKHPNAVDPEGGNVYLYGASGLIQDLGNSYEFDPNGSTIGRIGDQGLRAEDPHLYDAYGEPVWYYSAEPGLGLRPDYNGQVFLYKGQYGCVTDTDTGLVYCHHRYYDPMACRWISRDPAGLEGGINTYQYCNGDPVDGADPSGLQPYGSILTMQQWRLDMKWYNDFPVASPLEQARIQSSRGQLMFDPEGYPVVIGGTENLLSGLDTNAEHAIARDVQAFAYSDNAISVFGHVHVKSIAAYQIYLTKPQWRAHEHWHLKQIHFYFHNDNWAFLGEYGSELRTLNHDRMPLELDANNHAGYPWIDSWMYMGTPRAWWSKASP